MPRQTTTAKARAAELARIKRAADLEFPPHYDAHNDEFSEQWDHEEAVNKLGRLLRDTIKLLEGT